MSLFKNESQYFLSISFEWNDIFRFLEVPEIDQKDFEIVEKYKYQSPNANNHDGSGTNNSDALFEYYIRNSGYSNSVIYDQQLKRFFESPNINYGPVLKNSKKENCSITCFFKVGMISKEKTYGNPGFTVCFTQENKWKAIVFTFDKKFLRLSGMDTKQNNGIPFESYEISYDGDGGKSVKKVLIDQQKIWINTNEQSQYDAQIGPFDMDLHNFLRNNGNE